MKEFIEKLIERLEEEKVKNPCRNIKCRECQYTGNCYEGEQSKKVAIDNAISIVNELAEEYNPKTNADRIRNMSDTELAEFLTRNAKCNLCLSDGKCCKEKESCEDGLLNWLQSEAE